MLFFKNRLQQLTDAEQISLKRNLKLSKSFCSKNFSLHSFFSSVRLNVDQWLQQTLQHNEQINTIDYDQSLIENKLLINQLITYLHNELNLFDKNFLSLILNPKLTNLFQQRIHSIETILQEKKNHQEIFQQVHQQIIEINQMINELKFDSKKEEFLQKFNQYKQDFNQIKNQEYLQIQTILGTRLELAIRTLDADLQLIEQILDGKTLTDMIPSTSLITTKISRQPIQSKIHGIRDHLSTIAMDIKACRNEEKIPEDLLRIDTVSR